MHNVLKRLQSESGAPSRGPSLSIGTKCSPFCSPTLINQARRVGKHIGRPARRRLGRADIEKIGLLRAQGQSVRQLAKEFGASQWMIARLEPSSQQTVQRLLDHGKVNE